MRVRAGAQAAAPRLPRGIVPTLLRARPVIGSEHFDLRWKMLGQPPGVLLMAVPRRVLPRAVDRNAVRRVAREAWRAATLGGAPVVAMLRMTRLPVARGVRHRKAIVRAELDEAFGALGRRIDARRQGGSSSGGPARQAD
ncbi:MAG: ribonuclease P protein component [Burkholderiaceae bacterium]|nr:ribonuclease P protein component [Burkholderiaceae bacterium]